MRGNHPREAAEDRSVPSIEEIKAEHRKGKVRSRDRDQAVQVDSAPPQGNCSCHVRGRQGVQDKEERETHCRVELVCAHCVKRHQSSVSSALGDSPQHKRRTHEMGDCHHEGREEERRLEWRVEALLGGTNRSAHRGTVSAGSLDSELTMIPSPIKMNAQAAKRWGSGH